MTQHPHHLVAIATGQYSDLKSVHSESIPVIKFQSDYSSPPPASDW